MGGGDGGRESYPPPRHFLYCIIYAERGNAGKGWTVRSLLSAFRSFFYDRSASGELWPVGKFHGKISALLRPGNNKEKLCVLSRIENSSSTLGLSFSLSAPARNAARGRRKGVYDMRNNG